MFLPQWQTNTPTRGSWPVTSFSGGYSRRVVSVCLAPESRSIALQAAADASTTVSGMSFGPTKGPQA